KMIFSIVFAITSIGSMGKDDTGKENKKLTIGGIGANKEIELDRITDDDVVTQLMEELREFSPGAATALLDERDAYIAGSLLELDQRTFKKSLTKNASQQTLIGFDHTASQEKRKIVAVVGAGHVAGIKNLLSHPELIPPKESLCSLPKRRVGINIKGVFAIGFIVAILIILLSLIYSGISLQDILRVSSYWIVINGVLSAVGVVIARGHPLSVLTAFCASPFTSLSPFLAAGWFAGLAEAHFRKPTVEDAKSMLDVNSVGELMRNKLFKIVLVAALANVGS
ncbi:unnamed protein product, partial [marine sediment metagenome]